MRKGFITWQQCTDTEVDGTAVGHGVRVCACMGVHECVHVEVCVCVCVDVGRQPSTTEVSLSRCTCCTDGEFDIGGNRGYA